MTDDSAHEPVPQAPAPQTPAPQAAVLAPPARGSLPLAIAAGLGAAIIGALLWAVVTVVTNYELGVMAIAVGFVVGKAISITGKSSDQLYGILGAVCALIGCLLGNLFSAVGFFADLSHISYLAVFTDPAAPSPFELMQATFSPMDLIFYAIGIYEGYRFSRVPG